MKKVNNMTIFESTDKCSLDEYSGKMAIEVPELIKKAKEEVKQKVIEISENDIKQDNEIATLKTNHTNLQEQNTKLQSQIKKDRENMINLEVEGQSIHIEDSSELEGQLEVLGNVEQDVREGKKNKCPTQSKYWEIGEYNHVTGEKTVNNGRIRLKELLPISDKQLYFNTFTANYGFVIRTYDENKKFLSSLEGIPNKESTTLDDNIKYLGVILYNFNNGEDGEGQNILNKISREEIRPFICLNSEENKEFEQYGATPSPEYPSEIRAVGNNVNLFDKDSVIEGYFVSSAVVANKDWCYSVLQGIKPEEKITVSGGRCILSYFNGETNISYKDITDKTITIPNNTTKVYVSTLKTNLNILKLELGEVPTSYSLYGQGSVEIKKQNKNLLKLINTSLFISGIEASSNNETITINGTTGEKSVNIYGLFDDMFLKKGTYTFYFTCQNPPVPHSFQFILCEPDGKQVVILSAWETSGYKTITLEKDTKISSSKSYLFANKNMTFSNVTYKFQIQLGTKGTEIIAQQEQTKILPIQKPMLEGDYFIKETDGWKEVHKWGKVILDGIKNKFTFKHGSIQTSTNGFYQLILQGKIKGKNGDTNNGICNYLKYIGEENAAVAAKTTGIWWEGNINSNYASLPFLILDEANKWLQEKNTEGNPVYICYKLATPTKLPCTPEQTKILDELNNLPTYKPETNITTDSIAKLKLKYIADTKTYVDNKYNGLAQQILNLAGGNKNV